MYDEIKRRYDFASWEGITTLPVHLLLWRYRPRGTELAGWQVGSTRVLELPHIPRFLPSMWQRSGRHHKDALRLDTYEFPSRESAHEGLIHLLGEFSSPFMQRLTDTEFGDISFGGRDTSAVLFARANLVVLIANAGTSRLNVGALAGELDHDLIARPTACISTHAHEPVPVACAMSGPSSLIDVNAIAPQGRFMQRELAAAADTTQHKLFSQNCELSVEDDIVRVMPLKAGPQQVEIFTVERAGDWERRDVTIENPGPTTSPPRS